MAIQQGYRNPEAGWIKKCTGCGANTIKKVERVDGRKVEYWECPKCGEVHIKKAG